MGERPVATAKAHVMLYDTKSGSWNYSGNSQSLAKVQLYFNSQTNAYRVVGWSLQDREVVINCSIPRGLNYHKARPNFHQWRDAKQHVYGLSFASLDEAEAFAAAVDAALEQLAALKRQQSNSQPPAESQTVKQQQQQQLSGNGTNQIPQQQQPAQPQQPQMQYREQSTHFDQPNYAESNRSKREEIEVPGYAGVPIHAKLTANTTVLSRGEYAMPNTLQQPQQPVSHSSQSDYGGSIAGYRAPSLLSESGKSVNGSIGNGSVDGLYQSSSDDSVKGLIGRMPTAPSLAASNCSTPSTSGLASSPGKDPGSSSPSQRTEINIGQAWQTTRIVTVVASELLLKFSFLLSAFVVTLSLIYRCTYVTKQ
ncbi:hypothetical protein Aperf_G00000016100 [Anoplocephala perfoliata]